MFLEFNESLININQVNYFYIDNVNTKYEVKADFSSGHTVSESYADYKLAVARMAELTRMLSTKNF